MDTTDPLKCHCPAAVVVILCNKTEQNVCNHHAISDFSLQWRVDPSSEKCTSSVVLCVCVSYAFSFTMKFTTSSYEQMKPVTAFSQPLDSLFNTIPLQ
jgi:hypothetical protein